MSLARAFTTRRAKVFGGDSEGKPTRSNTVKGSISGPVRSKISGPVELVHTTNMLSYNAPDIRRGPKISGPMELIHTTNMLSYDAPDIHKEPKTAASNSSMSLGSDGDSDHIPTAASSPPTSPDTAFPPGDVKDDGKSPLEPNHLSCYFTLPSSTATTNAPPVPSLPKRAPSHSKKSLDHLSRKASISEFLGRKPSVSRLSEQSSRSISSKASGSFSRSSSASTSTTASSHSYSSHSAPKTSPLSPPPVPPTALSTSGAVHLHKESSTGSERTHPFGHELAQVTELAEEYATTATEKTRVIATDEEKQMSALGLQKFSPEEYLSEIQGLFATFFSEARQHATKAAPAQWI